MGSSNVRFTGDQDGQVAALRSAPGILAPERIVGYGVPAFHSMAELKVLGDLITDLRLDETWNSLGSGLLITRVSIDAKKNRVMVGACDPESVAPALIDRFGLAAPFSVVYQPPLERKSLVRDARRRTCGRG